MSQPVMQATQPMPARYRVTSSQGETYDTVTLVLRPVDQPIAANRPGQFTMLYAFGVGEVPISVSGPADGADLVQTIRSVGAVTRALCAAGPGQMIGVRGPYGTGWDVEGGAGQDVVLIAGGIGLAPLRPALLSLLAVRDARPEYIQTLATSTPIADHVRVDFELRGCPIDKRQLVELISALLAGRKPGIPAHSVCYECKLRSNTCVMVAHGTPCLGPVTQAGFPQLRQLGMDARRRGPGFLDIQRGRTGFLARFARPPGSGRWARSRRLTREPAADAGTGVGTESQDARA